MNNGALWSSGRCSGWTRNWRSVSKSCVVPSIDTSERVVSNLKSPVRQVERIDRPAHVPEGERAVIRGADADPGAVDDCLRHRPQSRAPMDAALQHHIAFLQRVDAEAEE